MNALQTAVSARFDEDQFTTAWATDSIPYRKWSITASKSIDWSNIMLYVNNPFYRIILIEYFPPAAKGGKRRSKPILAVTSYIRRGGERLEVKALPESEQRRLATAWTLRAMSSAGYSPDNAPIESGVTSH